MLENSVFPFGLSVDWARPASCQAELEASSSLMRDWLLDSGSLTERLIAASTHFEVQLLGQKALPLESSEKQALLKHDMQSWQVREVILKGDGQPWVFARSVIPAMLCESTWADLGNQPLGQRIFNDPNFVRSAFEVGKMQRHPLSHASFTQASSEKASSKKIGKPARWARRSIFEYEDPKRARGNAPCQVLVAEAFLPDCPCYLPEHSAINEVRA